MERSPPQKSENAIKGVARILFAALLRSGRTQGTVQCHGRTEKSYRKSTAKTRNSSPTPDDTRERVTGTAFLKDLLALHGDSGGVPVRNPRSPFRLLKFPIRFPYVALAIAEAKTASRAGSAGLPVILSCQISGVFFHDLGGGILWSPQRKRPTSALHRYPHKIRSWVLTVVAARGTAGLRRHRADHVFTKDPPETQGLRATIATDLRGRCAMSSACRPELG